MANVKQSKLVKDMARATGVPEGNVVAVLEQLGLSRVYNEAVKGNGGKEPNLAAAKVAFKIGKSTIVC